MDEILRLLALIRDFELLKRNTQQWESMPQVRWRSLSPRQTGVGLLACLPWMGSLM
jgi:hypothetical protein